MDCSTDALLQAARCLDCTIAPGNQGSVRSYLLCQWANKQTCDADALTYIAAAGITNQTDINAVCQLVASLKGTGAPSFWDRDDVIYPLLGTTYAQQRVNLRNPGTLNFVESAVPPTYSALGMRGNGATAYADTGYNPSTYPARSNSIRFMCYLDLAATTTGKYYWGGQVNAPTVRRNMMRRNTAAGQAFTFDININGAVGAAGVTGILGALFSQREDANNVRYAHPGQLTWQTVGSVCTLQTNANMWILSNNISGATDNASDARVSGWSAGAILTNAELAQYKLIWDTFEASLSTPRGHPLGV